MTTYSVGLARPEHLESLPAIERAAAACFPDHLIPSKARDGVVPRSVLEQACRERRLWVAELASGEPAGFAIALAEQQSAFLYEVDVHPTHQGKGLGRQLIAEVIQWARGQGFECVTLTTFENLPWNAPFYQRLGFRPLIQDELTRVLRERLAGERARGLKERVAMKFELT